MTALMRIHPRRPKEYLAPGGTRAADSRSAAAADAGAPLREALLRFRASSPHFRNTDFRGALEASVSGGLLAAALEAGPPPALRLARPSGGGVACLGDRRCEVHLLPGVSALDAALQLQGEGVCLKPGVVFAAHPSDGRRPEGLASEERELLCRTNWGAGFLDDATREGFQAGDASCLLAEYLLVLRGAHDPEDEDLDRSVLDYPEGGRGELAAAICFQPRRAEGVFSPEGRLEYKRQVEAVLQLCCLLDLDSVCVGCSEGIAGGALFGLPEGEVAQVWREVLQGAGPTESRAPLAAHFKRILFTSAGDQASFARGTARVLREALGDSLLTPQGCTGPKVRGNWAWSR